MLTSVPASRARASTARRLVQASDGNQPLDGDNRRLGEREDAIRACGPVDELPASSRRPRERDPQAGGRVVHDVLQLGAG